MEVKVGEHRAEPWHKAGASKCWAAFTISITVRTGVDSEHLAMWCRLGIRQTWVGIPVQMLTVWPGAYYLPSLSWFPCLKKGGNATCSRRLLGDERPCVDSEL